MRYMHFLTLFMRANAVAGVIATVIPTVPERDRRGWVGDPRSEVLRGDWLACVVQGRSRRRL